MKLNWKAIAVLAAATLAVALVGIWILSWSGYSSPIGYVSPRMMGGRGMTALGLVSPLWWLGRVIVPVGLLGLIVLAVALALRATSTPAVRAKQEPMCDDCGQLLEADWQTCPYCGAELVATSGLTCSNCRKPVLADWSFCPFCSTALA